MSKPTYLQVIEKVPRQGVVVPAVVPRNVEMKTFQKTSFGYTLLSGSFSLPVASLSTEYKVFNGDAQDDFRGTNVLSDTCVSPFLAQFSAMFTILPPLSDPLLTRKEARLNLILSTSYNDLFHSIPLSTIHDIIGLAIFAHD